MSFAALLGNEQLKENLRRSINSRHISHFYLISGPEGSGKHTLARLLAAAILCRSPEKPCLSCSVCRKVLENNHPDLITVEDPEHKNVAVKLVREYREDMFIRPNESDYKIYLFPQELGVEGQNALLKILEEPPSYGVFMLLTDNPEKLLPTVRSRCTELTLQPLPPALLAAALEKEFPQAQKADIDAAVKRSGGFLGQAKTLLAGGELLLPQTRMFLQSFAAKDPVGLLQTLVPMEKWKREQLLTALNQWLELLGEALACQTGGIAPGSLTRDLCGHRTARELANAIEQLQQAITYAHSNVSAGAICGYLAWALR